MRSAGAEGGGRSNALGVAEAAATAVAGGALAALTGSLVDLTIVCAVVGAANGAICGWRAIYRWRAISGPFAFALDSTWALPMTLAALIAHAVARVQSGRADLIGELSTRRNRHVYAHGLRIRKGFVMTLGNTINGAGPVVRTSSRRQKLITDHEDVHVWQARWWGPLYPVLYVGWSIMGGAIGAVVWLLRRRSEPFSKVVETCAYYLNPFEWWAYSRDDLWPPPGKVDRLGWSSPIVRPFSATARCFGRGRPRTPPAPS